MIEIVRFVFLCASSGRLTLVSASSQAAFSFGACCVWSGEVGVWEYLNYGPLTPGAIGVGARERVIV